MSDDDYGFEYSDDDQEEEQEKEKSRRSSVGEGLRAEARRPRTRGPLTAS